MPGNKRNKRLGKSAKKRRSAIDRLHEAEYVKHRDKTNAEYTMIKMRNALPIGHELNRHKIDMTFQPLESLLASVEETGEITTDTRGDPVMWDEQEECWMPLGPGIHNMVAMFDRAAQIYSWPESQPPGLRRLGAKLDADMPLFQSDTDDARVTIAWMRKWIVGVTPNQWTEISEQMVREFEAATQDQRKAA